MALDKQKQVVFETSLQVFITKIIDLVQEGWELDPDQMPNQSIFSFEAGLTRHPTQEQIDADFAETGKLSRSEILRRARAAKAAKAAGGLLNED